jgi:hypothetical protein
VRASVIDCSCGELQSRGMEWCPAQNPGGRTCAQDGLSGNAIVQSGVDSGPGTHEDGLMTHHAASTAPSASSGQVPDGVLGPAGRPTFSLHPWRFWA